MRDCSLQVRSGESLTKSNAISDRIKPDDSATVSMMESLPLSCAENMSKIGRQEAKRKQTNA
jgi:hypothetical protein